MLAARWRFRWAEAHGSSRFLAKLAASGCDLVQHAVAGLDRALQFQSGKKPKKWDKECTRSEAYDADLIVNAVKSGRLDAKLAPYLRDRTHIAALVMSRLEHAQEAVNFFVWAAKQPGFRHDIDSSNQLLDTLCRCGRSLDALAIFKKRFYRIFKANATTYTMLVRGLCHARLMDEACEVFSEMQGRCGLKAGKAVYTMILSGLLKAGRRDEALSHFQMMREFHQLDSTIYSTMVYELTRLGSPELAFRVVEEMIQKSKTPDMASVHVVLDLLCRNDRPKDAWKVLKWMRRAGTKLDTVISTYVVRKLCEAGELEEALNAVDEAVMGNEKERWQPDLVTYSVVVDGLCGAQRLRDSWKYMERMVTEEKLPDVEAFRKLLDSYSKFRLAEDGQDLARRKPTPTMYALLIYGLCRTGQVEEALELYREVLSGSTATSVLTYSVMIHGLGKAGRGVEAEEVFSDMIAQNCSPQTVTYNALVSGLCRVGRVDRALELLKEMAEKKECLPDSGTYIDLLDKLCELERVDEALVLLREVSGKGLEIDVEVHNTVEALLRKAERASDAEEVVRMKRKMEIQAEST